MVKSAKEKGEHLGARADGSIASGGDRAGSVHHSRHGPSLLRRRPSWPRGLRAGAGKVRDEQAQRPLTLKIVACATGAAKHDEDRRRVLCWSLPLLALIDRSAWNRNSRKFPLTEFSQVAPASRLCYLSCI